MNIAIWPEQSRRSESPPLDDTSCQLLWMRVLERLLNDAIGNHPAGELADRKRIQANARSYFNVRNIDFRIVCLLAGLENPDRVITLAEKTIADSDEAAAAGKKFKLPTFEKMFGHPISTGEDEDADDRDDAFFSDQIVLPDRSDQWSPRKREEPTSV